LVVVLLPFRVFPQRKLGIFLNRSFRRKRRKRTVFFTRNVLRERERCFFVTRAQRKGEREREREKRSARGSFDGRIRRTRRRERERARARL